MKARLAVAAIMVAVSCVGCGYGLAGRGSVLPESVKTIAVTPFENRTNQPQIEQRVTEQVASELAKRGKYRVVTDPAGADALLEGAVVEYRSTPVQFTSEGRATRVEAVVSVQATLRDLAEDQVLWSQAGLLFREQYDVPGEGEFIDLSQAALDDIAKGAAGAVVTSILEGF